MTIMIAGMHMFQDRLIYFPTRASVAQIASGQLAAWPTPQDFRGLVAEPAAGSASGGIRGTAIVFHGNAGHAGHRTFYAQALTGLGLRVVLAEYPAYGPRDGDVGERNLVDDAEQTIILAHRRHGGPLLLIGESLGAAVAAAAAARQVDKIAGIVLFTPWDRLANVGSHHYPWLPVKWLLRDRYDNAANLANVRVPLVIVVAQDDEIVPVRFGMALYEGLAQPKRLFVLPAVGHNDWTRRTDPGWWREVIDPLLPTPAAGAPGSGR